MLYKFKLSIFYEERSIVVISNVSVWDLIVICTLDFSQTSIKSHPSELSWTKKSRAQPWDWPCPERKTVSHESTSYRFSSIRSNRDIPALIFTGPCGQPWQRPVRTKKPKEDNCPAAIISGHTHFTVTSRCTTATWTPRGNEPRRRNVRELPTVLPDRCRVATD